VSASLDTRRRLNSVEGSPRRSPSASTDARLRPLHCSRRLGAEVERALFAAPVEPTFAPGELKAVSVKGAVEVPNRVLPRALQLRTRHRVGPGLQGPRASFRGASCGGSPCSTRNVGKGEAVRKKESLRYERRPCPTKGCVRGGSSPVCARAPREGSESEALTILPSPLAPLEPMDGMSRASSPSSLAQRIDPLAPASHFMSAASPAASAGSWPSRALR
jgi:hypothetical protein